MNHEQCCPTSWEFSVIENPFVDRVQAIAQLPNLQSVIFKLICFGLFIFVGAWLLQAWFCWQTLLQDKIHSVQPGWGKPGLRNFWQYLYLCVFGRKCFLKLLARTII